MHAALLEELQKCLQPFELHAKTSTLPLPRRKEAEYFAKLILDTSYIVKTHTHMVTLYRTLSNPQSSLQYVELIKFLEKVERQVHTHITHPVLENIKTNINTELFILHKLFLAEAQMTINHQFRETLFNIYQSRADLHTWKSRMEASLSAYTSNSSGQSAVTSSSSAGFWGRNISQSALAYTKIPLYIWLSEFVNAMLSKMTLFFYKPLWRQERLTGTVDMRNHIARLDSPYPQLIETFCQKTECTFFCLVLEAEGIDGGYSPDGYVCPDDSIEQEPLTGMKLFPVIFSIPYIDDPQSTTPHHLTGATSSMNSVSFGSSSASSSSQTNQSNTTASGPLPQTESRLIGEHLPSIVVLLQDNIDELNTSRQRPICVTYAGTSANDYGTTYYLFKVSPKITAALVFKRRIKIDDSTDSAVVDLKNVLTSNLKNIKIFSRIVPKD